MNIRDDLGQVSGESPEERFSRLTTKSLRWPNNCIFARDQSAERLNRSLNLLEDMVINGTEDFSPRALANLTIILLDLQAALRWLESVGAQTQPKQL